MDWVWSEGEDEEASAREDEEEEEEEEVEGGGEGVTRPPSWVDGEEEAGASALASGFFALAFEVCFVCGFSAFFASCSFISASATWDCVLVSAFLEVTVSDVTAAAVAFATAAGEDGAAEAEGGGGGGGGGEVEGALSPIANPSIINCSAAASTSFPHSRTI